MSLFMLWAPDFRAMSIGLMERPVGGPSGGVGCFMAENRARNEHRGFARKGCLARRAAAAAVCTLLVFCILAIPAACVNRVIPPAPISDPVQIFILDHGRTPSLVLPTPDGGMVRYVYGDWNWYAKGRTGIGYGIAALFWPTRAGLGRELLEGAAGAESVLAQISVEVEAVHPLLVERAAVERLAGRLEALFGTNAATRVENEAYQLSFVHHPDRYSYFWNSNHQVAHWLRELGCEVRGPTVNSKWEVRQPRHRR
jgi:hypothetical protein